VLQFGDQVKIVKPSRDELLDAGGEAKAATPAKRSAHGRRG
jgi:hypothetical protein